ncbi:MULTISPECIES: metallophosphoesterase [unclassified Curtobacterium]|uniref:metallophosphoesterase family protein n=1 Tax=unclassified Curtobacterium TaxID=257496 RepID=UPI000F49AA32|nr:MULTISPECIES: metallophosphoesterase [unclassified Curtobacterium]ROQ05143.1 Icc-related predicted phosphoesterase [Curtobacterium sp. PhB171]ROQ22344.1 Icc-related predicted phosphoesterase [Curtobacterium sp. PhB170]ROS33704.1 Icc-related predicted phosphoesterase [Curtobacterium sp. PhB131]ROS65023.1 Icc-related predicted phosphoesterase [Curtobacterium sp. PhB141]TCL71521.1 Icc-related predicted phosphoesterase [Curtobacterium sp. PhB128]
MGRHHEHPSQHDRASPIPDGHRAPEFDADSVEELIVVAGDWHTDLVHLVSNVPQLLDANFPDGSYRPTTLLHAGDFNITNGSRANKQFIRRAAQLAAERKMRILITPGNHDSWSRLEARTDFSAGRPIRLAGAVWVLPRGYRFRMGGRRVLSFGGAGSFSRPVASEGVTWWRSEMPSNDEVADCVSLGGAEILIAHEAPTGGSSRVDDMLARSPLRDPVDRAYTALGRERLRQVWDGVHPQLLFHGHHHIQAEGHHPDGRSVYALNKNGEPGNLAAVDLATMRVRWLDNVPLRRGGY